VDAAKEPLHYTPVVELCLHACLKGGKGRAAMWVRQQSATHLFEAKEFLSMASNFAKADDLWSLGDRGGWRHNNGDPRNFLKYMIEGGKSLDACGARLLNS
jgi:hypothetical protein